jgi:hypothetical protein
LIKTVCVAWPRKLNRTSYVFMLLPFPREAVFRRIKVENQKNILHAALHHLPTGPDVYLVFMQYFRVVR